MTASSRLAGALLGFAACCLPLTVAADDIPFNSRLEVQGGDASIEGTNGYVTLGGLAGVGLDRDYEDGMVFLDLAGHYTFEGDPAFNAALGYRYADWDDGVVWGINAGLSGRSFDDNWYLWCNIGLERLAPEFDLRANGYLRCGDGIKDERCETVGFEGNSLLVATRADLGMQGFDLSIGSDAGALLSEDLYGKAEFYAFFDRSDDSAIGGRATLDWQLLDNVAVNGWVSYDSLFGVSGLAGITLSFGGPAERSDKADTRGTGQRLISFIERREILPVHEDARVAGSTHAVTDENGDPLPFWHVDNTAAPGGDGSFEHPFDTLAEAGAEAGITGPGDVIIFHEGDGTTANQTDGITLQDGQYFLAASLNQPIEFDGCFCTLSELSDEGRPVMTDDDGDALRLADNNTTGGYDIEGAAEQGVSGDGTNSLRMFDIGISGSGGSGIEIVNGTGTFLFSNLRVTGNAGNFPVDDAGGGFNLLDMAGEVTIEDTLCSDNGDRASGLTRRYDCVEITGGANGALDVVVRRTQFLDNWGNGLETHQVGNDPMSVVLEDSLFERNTESAVTLNKDPAPEATPDTLMGAVDWTITGNVIRNNGWGGLQLFKGLGTGTMRALIEDNVIVDNSTIPSTTPGTGTFNPQELSGIGLDVRGGISDVVIRSNVLSGHQSSGAYIAAGPQTPGITLLRLLIEGNTITGNGFGRDDDQRGGIYMTVSGRDTTFGGMPIPVERGDIQATIRDNIIDGNALRGSELFNTVGIVGSPPLPPGQGCVSYQANSGADTLNVNNGVNRFFRTNAVTVRERIAGGPLSLDPASGGNSVPVTQLGSIDSSTCQTVQGF